MSVPKTAPAKVLFCPFCGGGTLLLGEDQFLWTCLKCKREFSVAVAVTGVNCDEAAESVKDAVALCRKHREQVENDRNIYNPERDAPKSFDAAHDFTGRAD